jgi:hypothetical protein
MDDDDRYEVWMMVVNAFLEIITNPRNSVIDIETIRNRTNRILEKNIKKARRAMEKFSRIEIDFDDLLQEADNETPIQIITLLDYTEVWSVISKCITNKNELDWVRGIIVSQVSLPGFEPPTTNPKLNSYKKIKIRDMIADAIRENIPRLKKYVKEKNANKRRRGYESR